MWLPLLRRTAATAAATAPLGFALLPPRTALARRLATTTTTVAMKSVADLRKEYSAVGLEEATVPPEPFALFRQWLDEAVQAKVVEPNAMCLSTVCPTTGRPSARYVLLKGLDPRGFVWYTNYESRKGQELPTTSNKEAFACLTFWWGDLERSVRVEGRVERVSEAESQEYFDSRPRGSRLGAWASNQSRPIASREALQAQFEDVAARFGGVEGTGEIAKPPHWGGYVLRPDRMEFWKGRQSRLHDRLAYTLQGKEGEGRVWGLERLQP